MYKKLVVLFLFVSIGTFAENQPIPYSNSMNVDGYNLGYTCKGTNLPVVILEPPSGVGSEEAFKNIFGELSRTNKTCIYARLGNGKDGRAEGLNLTGWDYVKELTELIRLEARNQPLILVGYSYGSFVARLYASKHSDTVKGLLLIDPPHHQWLQSMKREMNSDDWDKMNSILTWFKKYRGHNVWDTQFEVAKTSLSPMLPIVIVSRGLDEIKIKKANLSEVGFRQFNDIHFKLVKEFDALTENTEHIIAPNSRHLILDSEPDVVIKAFKKLSQKIKR